MLLGVYKGTRFLTKLMSKIDDVEKKFGEMHHTATVDNKGYLKELVRLAQVQNRRWETWMMSKAAQGEHHEHHVSESEVMLAESDDNENTEV